jgi:hypothetical protein
MTTIQLGIPISQHRYPPAPPRPNPSGSSPPGAQTPPNPRPAAPNKPNNRPPRPQNADPPRETNPIAAGVLSVVEWICEAILIQPLALSAAPAESNGKAQRSRMDLPNIDARLTPISPLKCQISNPQPCTAALSSAAPNKPNFREPYVAISASCEMCYAESGPQARAQNKPRQSQCANPGRRDAPRWQDRPIPRIMPRLSTRRRMENG